VKGKVVPELISQVLCHEDMRRSKHSVQLPIRTTTTTGKALALVPGRDSNSQTQTHLNYMCMSCNINLNEKLAIPSKNLKLQTSPLVREGAPHQQARNCLKIIKERRGKIGRGSQMGARHQDRLADWPSVVIWLWLWLILITAIAVIVPAPAILQNWTTLLRRGSGLPLGCEPQFDKQSLYSEQASTNIIFFTRN
jgi:hypothetical protein